MCAGHGIDERRSLSESNKKRHCASSLTVGKWGKEFENCRQRMLSLHGVVWGGSPCWLSEADMLEALAAFTKLQALAPCD